MKWPNELRCSRDSAWATRCSSVRCWERRSASWCASPTPTGSDEERPMWISDFAIRRPIITVTVMLAIVAFGLTALMNLQVDEFPDLDQPVVMVQIPYPGASPEVVEREVVEPVEEAIFGLSGIDRRNTTSNSVDGLAQFTITFEYTKPVAEASQDVRDA